jgi:hypothetical protein
MSLLEKLSINKKITAFFVDGSSKMNLGIATVVDLLNGAERVPVQIAPVKRAERLLTDLAESAGRTIQKVEGKATTVILAAVFAIAMTTFSSVAASDFEGVWKVKDTAGQTFEITLSSGGQLRRAVAREWSVLGKRRAIQP